MDDNPNINDRKCNGCKCHWRVHKNMQHKYVLTQKEVEKTYDDLKEKYGEATTKK